MSRSILREILVASRPVKLGMTVTNDSGNSNDFVNPRRASITIFEGTPIGACIVLSAEDLQHLGVDPVEDAAIQYGVTADRRLCIRVPDDGEGPSGTVSTTD